MIRAETSVRMLQAIAMIATLAVLLWSLGLPSLQFASAANLTTISDTLSDSAPAASSTHTFVFTTPTGVVAGEYATVTMPTGFTNIAALTSTDVTVATATAATVGATCGAVDVAFTTSGQDLIFEFCTAAGAHIDAGGTTTISVGAIPGNAIVNPTPVGDSQSYEVNVAAGSMDTGATRIVILGTVTVTASVDTIFTFAVSGLPGGTAVNGHTTTGTSSTTTIPFGKLDAGVASTAAQRLTVSTNAANGYVVTVQADGAFESATGAIIDDFVDGTSTNVPTAWTGPTPVLGTLESYGHWGVTSDDTVTTRTVEFGSQEYVTASTSPIVVMSNDGPANGAGVGVGTTTVGYRVEISALQEAADDYEAVLTYIATPTF